MFSELELCQTGPKGPFGSSPAALLLTRISGALPNGSAPRGITPTAPSKLQVEWEVKKTLPTALCCSLVFPARVLTFQPAIPVSVAHPSLPLTCPPPLRTRPPPPPPPMRPTPPSRDSLLSPLRRTLLYHAAPSSMSFSASTATTAPFASSLLTRTSREQEHE
jgi:hypothetical protein